MRPISPSANAPDPQAWFRLLGITLLCTLVAMGVQAVIGRVFPAWTDTAAMARFTAGWFTVLLFGAPGVLCGLLSKETAAEVGFRRPPGKALGGIVVAALALQPALQGLSRLWGGLLSAVLSEEAFSRLLEVQSAREASIARIVGEGGWGGLPAVVLVLAVLPALCEELFFRGTIQRMACRGRRRTAGAILGVSLLFAAVHPDAMNTPGIFLCSVLLGYSYLWSGNLWIPAGFHLTSNLANLLPVYLPGIVPAVFPGWSIAASLILTAVALRVVAKSCRPKEKRHPAQ